MCTKERLLREYSGLMKVFSKVHCNWHRLRGVTRGGQGARAAVDKIGEKRKQDSSLPSLIHSVSPQSRPAWFWNFGMYVYLRTYGRTDNLCPHYRPGLWPALWINLAKCAPKHFCEICPKSFGGHLQKSFTLVTPLQGLIQNFRWRRWSECRLHWHEFLFCSSKTWLFHLQLCSFRPSWDWHDEI